MLVDVLNEFLNWDSKFLATIGLLIAKPWRLTNEFLAGHRVRYVHPLRLYLLASILFFVAATYGIKSTHFSPINLSPEDRADIRNELERENVAPEVRAKVEQVLGGLPLEPKKRAALEEKLKNENLPKEARNSIEERLQHGDLPPNAKELSRLKHVNCIGVLLQIALQYPRRRSPQCDAPSSRDSRRRTPGRPRRRSAGLCRAGCRDAAALRCRRRSLRERACDSAG